MTFKFVRARDRTRLPCEFGNKCAQQFRRHMIHKQKVKKKHKKVTDSAKNRILCSLLHTVINTAVLIISTLFHKRKLMGNVIGWNGIFSFYTAGFPLCGRIQTMSNTKQPSSEVTLTSRTNSISLGLFSQTNVTDTQTHNPMDNPDRGNHGQLMSYLGSFNFRCTKQQFWWLATNCRMPAFS